MKALIVILMSLFLFLSCGEEKGSQGKVAAPNLPEPNGPSVKADTLPEQGLTVVGDGEESFGAWNQRLETSIFGEDYKSVSMDQVDKQPRLLKAIREKFVQYRKKKPVNSKYGKQYPRFVWKAWQFSSRKQMETELLEWLNSHDSSDPDSISLGENVDALKSPPLVCAVFDKVFFIAKGACLYGESWNGIADNFKEVLAGEQPRYHFEIGCEGGKLSYLP